MINRNDEIQQKNIDLLIEGYWYEDLPPVIDMEKIKKSVKNIIENIDNDVYEDFRKTNDIITEYKNTEAPTYIFNDGIEPITFFEFKKNGALREMQIPNLKYYCTFVYNTISVYDELFYKLYNESEYDKYVSNSNSYILFNELLKQDIFIMPGGTPCYFRVSHLGVQSEEDLDDLAMRIKEIEYR